MKAYGKNAKKRLVRQKVAEECDVFIEHCDLIYLMVLHKQSGFGAVRLRRHFHEFVRMYGEYKRRYTQADDLETLGIRCDTLALKEQLAAIGFDYDKECELAHAEIDAEEKN